MTKILHIAPILGVGGVSRLLSEIIPLMNREDDLEVSLLVSNYRDPTFLHKLKAANVNVRSLNISNIYTLDNIFKIADIIKEYDLIHVHLFPSIYIVALANLFAKKPLVYTEHATNNRRRDKWYLKPFEKWVYSKYCKIISIGNGTEANLIKWINAEEGDNRFVVIENGVNLQIFKKSNNVRSYPHTLIMVGRFAPEKDQATIIRAMTLLDKDVHLILVGDGETFDSCKKLASELAVSERVHFVGTQADVPSWIGKADVGIQSSHWEGFGLTAVEMMAGGLPVVACDVEGVKQVVEGAGVLFPHGDYEKLAEEIKKLLYDKDYYELVKDRCLERSEMYDIKTMAESYVDVYKEILQKR